MPVDVIILPRGLTFPLDWWRESEIPDKSGAYKFNMDKWRELPLTLARRALNGDWSQPEVFLCPRGDLLQGRYESHYFDALVKTARDHCWGAKIFIAINRKISNQISSPNLRNDDIQALIEWFEAIHKVSVADLIEADFSWSRYQEKDNQLLSNGGAGSRARQRNFQALRRYGDWRCQLVHSAKPIKPILESYSVYSESAANDSNLLTVVNFGHEGDQKMFVKPPNPGSIGKRGVLLCGNGGLRTPFLEELCERENMPLLHCGGSFELRYLLMRQPDGYTPEQQIGYENCEQVELDANPLFATTPEVSPEVCLLLTSSLDPSLLRDQELCGKASIVAARLTYRLPPHTNYFAHPALKSKALPDILDEVLKSQSELTVWVFLGHGDGREGLYSVNETYAESPELWLTRFEAYRGKSLALAFFSSCRSTDVARCFAKAGVGVAIGFEQNVPAEPCQVLAETVVRAALYTNGNQQEILRAFQHGLRQLSAREYERYGPKAFYSLR